jgi:glycosyltransferase involved in cell wall biosynthesis
MSKRGVIKPKSNPNPIFIHSLWRSGSTYMFNVFRRSKAGYFCYQEPLHEFVFNSKDDPNNLLQIDGDILLPLRHPRLDQPYYYELLQTADYWKDVITKPIIYDQYFDSTCSEEFSAYISTLIYSAKGRPVIQECRTCSRIGAIKDKFSGVHIYLWRNPWDQWWSYKSTNYFDLTTQLILNSTNYPVVISKLRTEINFIEMHHDDINDEFAHFDQHRLSAEDSYLAYYVLWIISMHEADNSADIQICIDTLSENYEYQNDVLQKLSTFGVEGVDFSDCIRSLSTFSEQDKLFFQRIEDRAHGLILSSGYGQKKLNAILEKRLKLQNRIQKSNEEKNICKIIESNARAHEIILRNETENSSRLSYLNKIIIDERNRSDWLQNQWNASKSSAKLMESVLSEKEIAFDAHRLKIEEDILSKKHAFEIQLTEANKKLSEVEAKHEALVNRSHERELQLSAELLTTQQSAEQVKSNLLQAHSQQLIELQTEANKKLSKVEAKHEALVNRSHERELQLSAELLTTQQSAEQVKSNLLQAHSQQLIKLQIDHQQRERNLQLQLADLQDELIGLRSDLIWRMTAPLRAIAARFKSPSHKFASRSRALEQKKFETITTLELDGSKSVTQENFLNCLPLEQNFMVKNLAIQALPPKESVTTSNLKTLLQQNDNHFIEFAYQTLLRRSPDDEGLTYYLKRLSEGVPKLRILGQIAASAEARKLGVKLPGLNKAIRQQKMIDAPFFGWVFQIFMDDESSNAMSSLNGLLSLNGNEFIENTYLTLLQRKPDGDGLNFYLERLLSGAPKIQILDQILNSPEAKTKSIELPGLRNAIMLYKLAKLPLVGYIIRTFINVEGSSSSERRLRRIEQRLFQVYNSNNQRFEEIDIKLFEHKQLLKQHLADKNYKIQPLNNRRIYVDVTTLIKWSRPPVGIVRVLLELVRYSLAQETVDFFHFNNTKDDIKTIDREVVKNLVERLVNLKNHSNSNENNQYFRELQLMLDFQKTTQESSEDLSPFYDGTLSSLLSPEILIANNSSSVFKSDDIVISIGLDWDSSNYPILFWLKKRIGFKFVGAFYDGIPVVAPNMLPSFGFSQMFFQHIYNLVNLSDKIFSISRFSENQLRTIINVHGMRDVQNIKTIYLGDSIRDLRRATQSASVTRKHSKNYAIYVSTVETRKNHKLMLDVWRKMIDAKIPNIPDLVCVGMWGWGIEELRESYFSDNELQKYVHFYDDVDDEELAILYQNAKFSVFPSYMEGWGLGASESLSYGVPCIISTAPALIEATQGLMPSADPDRPEEWIALIEKILYEDGYIDALRKKIDQRFVQKTWDNFCSDFYSFVMEK